MQRARTLLTLLVTMLAIPVITGCSLASGEPIPAGPIERGPLPGEVADVSQHNPDITNGASIYLENCAACHGLTGEGDGASAATLSEQGVDMPDLTTQEIAGTRTPEEWHSIITNGTMGSGGMMPPWGNSLTDAEIWDVTLYLYTLGLSTEDAAQAQAIYEEVYADCIGTPAFEELIRLNPDQLINGPLSDTSSCPVAADLVDADMWPVALYMMSGSTPLGTTAASADLPSGHPPIDETGAAEAGEQVPAEEPADAEEAPADEAETVEATGTISGVVSLGVDNTAPTSSMEINLRGLTFSEAGGMDEFLSQTTTINADGSYTFTDVPFDVANGAYVVSTQYEGVEFTNGSVIEPGMTSLDLPIGVYSRTTDSSGIEVSMLHVVVEDLEDGFIVTQVYVFSNNTDSVYLTDQPVTDDLTATVALAMPEGASGVEFQNGQLGGRFIQQGDRIYDTWKVYPGAQSHTVVMRYYLPEGAGLDIPTDYAVSEVSVLAAPGLNLRGGELESTGVQQFEDGTSLESYRGTSLSAGETFSVNIRRGGGIGISPLAIGISVVLLSGAALAFLLFKEAQNRSQRSRRAAPRAQPKPEGASRPAARPLTEHPLVRRIAELDAAFEDGRISRLEYEEKRAALRLALMQEGS
ncbi:MAG: c-type cytochrome [Anaerolineae bacterium]